MKYIIKLAMVMIPLGLIIAAVPENTTKQYKLTAQEMINEVQTGQQFVHPDAIAAQIVSNDPELQLIDVRSKDEYDKFHLPNAINIPLANLLNPDNADVIDQGIKTNVFYSNGSTRANEVWMITRQLGYKNNYVLLGGLNFWIETISNPEKPRITSPDDEFAKYDFRMGASQALGGGGQVAPAASAPSSGSAIPAVTPKPKKKRAAGGC